MDAEEVEVEKMARWTVCFSNSVPRFSCDEMFFMKLNRWLLLDGVPLDCGDRTLEGKRTGVEEKRNRDICKQLPLIGLGDSAGAADGQPGHAATAVGTNWVRVGAGIRRCLTRASQKHFVTISSAVADPEGLR